MRTFMNWKFMIAALVSLGNVVGCGKSPSDEPGDLVDPDGRFRVTFSVRSVSKTKAAVTPYEDAITSLDVVAFRTADGKLEGHARSTNVGRVTVSLTGGEEVNYYVVANAPEGTISGFARESAFLAGMTHLSQSTATSLVMQGGGTMRVTRREDPVKVYVDRYVSKVSVESVSVKFMDESTPPTVTLRRVALVNAVGSTPWSMTPTTEGVEWYNKMGDMYAPGSGASAAERNVADMLIAEYGISITSSAAVSLDKSLYAMPNPTDNAVYRTTHPEWSVRDTRVAVELLIDGVSNWYPVNLPRMQANHHYIIRNMTVLGHGVENPDDPVERAEVEFEIIVEEWGEHPIDVDFS